MTGEVEAVGDAVTGALLAHAVDGGEAHGDAQGGLCLNCGTALIGAYCHHCGQSAHVHRSLSAIGHELLHGVVHFEGKLWRTLPLLISRPGELTRRYIDGERARFLSPMGLFLFSIFSMFAVFSIIGLSPPPTLDPTVEVHRQFDERREVLVRERDRARDERAGLAATDARAQTLDRRVAEAEAGLKELADAEAQLDENGLTSGRFSKAELPHTGLHWLDHGLEKWQKNPALMLYKLQSSGYKFSWLLIPLSLPFVWLLFFWRRDLHLYDHMTFVTYSIAFMSLLFIVLSVLGAMGLGSTWLGILGSTIPIGHIFRQLKGTYGLGTAPAVIRTVLLTLFIGVIMILFLLALLALGISG